MAMMAIPAAPTGVAPDNTGGKQAGGHFRRGQSGNPRGRPRGVRNRITVMMEELLAGEAEGIARVVIAAALRGDLVAARLVLDRVAPLPRDRTIRLTLPDVSGPADLPVALAALLQAVVTGVITPIEAEIITRLFTAYRSAMEVAHFDERLRKLEERFDGNP